MQNQTAAFARNANATQTKREYYLDWLRNFALLSVFFHHCSKIFDYHTTDHQFDIYNAVKSFAPSVYREFNALWIMPLFFVLSGASVFLSLRSRKTREFITARIRRLLIPLILIGTFVINPLYIYIIRLFGGKAESGFIRWYPHFFDGVYGFGGNFAPLGQGTHLWYLEFLFIYSLVLLPLFIRSKKLGISYLSKWSIHFEKPWALFFLFLPISAVAAAFEIFGLGGVRVMGGWDPISYLLFFAYGYLIFANERIQETIGKYGTIYLVAAIILTALYLDSHFGVNLKIPAVTRHDYLNNGVLLPLNHAGWTAIQAFRGLLVWCWIIGLLGLGRRFLNFNNKFLAYANEAGLPFYILHHTIILIIGYFIIQWSSGIGTKYYMISITSFTIIMAIYEILVRRVNILRFLFGMKLNQPRLELFTPLDRT